MISFLGKSHLLLLHLPIGILLIAVILELSNYFKIIKASSNLRSYIFSIGSISALLAVISGLILSTNGDYIVEDYQLHKLWAIGTTLICLLITGLYISKRQKSIPALSGILAIGIILTGHLGGTLTHGSIFTNSNEDDESQNAVFNINNVENTIVYEDVIMPIFEAKCISCHGPDKKKGKLSLEDIESFQHGGKSGDIINDGVLDKSELLVRTNSDLNEKGHMPPKRKKQLTKSEKEVIDLWVNSGASFSSSVSESDQKTDLIEIIQSLIQESKVEGDERKTIEKELPNVKVKAPSESIIRKMFAADIVAIPSGENSSFLDINFINVEEINSGHWDLLKKVGLNISTLKLSGQSLTNEDLTEIGKFKNLVTLHLDNTGISDEGLHLLKSLQYLSYLNLNETNVSNEGLLNLKELTNLYKIFATNTKVTPDIKKQMDNVYLSIVQLEQLESDTIRIQ